MTEVHGRDNTTIGRLVLASQSPRRLELLKFLGLQFDVVPSRIDENSDLKDPAEFVKTLAVEKATDVVDQLKSAHAGHSLVLGADTIVVLNNEILGKPTSREDAYQMLMRMSGRCHRVFTGVTLIDNESGNVETRHEMSSVYFRSLDPAEVRCYVKTNEPMDKAGSYALQGTASAFVEKIEGCYTNIIGLPIPLTVKMLRAVGYPVLGLP